MYKKVVGVYSIGYESAGIIYYGSSISITSRLNEHRRLLRNNIHKNQFLQNAWNKYGNELEFKIVELCSEEVLRVREQHYIDNAKCRLMNMVLEVCEIASSETHSLRMATAWSNRNDDIKKALSDKISNTVKNNFQDKPELLEQARNGLIKGREKLKESGYFENGLRLAQEKGAESLRKMWADPERKKQVSSNISKGMSKHRFILRCELCNCEFEGNPTSKYCTPACRVRACKQRLKTNKKFNIADDIVCSM